MKVENISTLDRLIATRQIAMMAGTALIVQNLDIAIKDLKELKVIMFKNMESTFTAKREKDA